MKKEIISQQLSQQAQPQGISKSSISRSFLHKVGRKMVLKLCGIVKQYQRSGTFSEEKMQILKTQLYLAARRSSTALQNELEMNRVCCGSNTHRYQLIQKVAHGRTFGKIINKCPTCRPGQLDLELEEGRYICSLPVQFSHMIPLPPNCGLAFDFSEIQHLPWMVAR